MSTGTTKTKDLDDEEKIEFGGPIGVTLMMICFPLLMYYFYLCLALYDGTFFYPKSLHPADMIAFVNEFCGLVIEHCAPTLYATQIYVTFIVFEAVLAVTMPGPVVKGFPIPSEGGKQLEYLCNGVASFNMTCLIAAILHFTKVFPITTFVDHFGPIMTVAMIAGHAVTWATYWITVVFGKPHRMTGFFMYDLFMGAALNPRIGKLDLKIWAEIRIPWIILFFITVSAAVKQYETYGYVSTPLLFMVLAHWLYVNACMKGEECIPTTWDIFYEKWGFMLIFWNLAGVPFSYCYSTLYLLHQHPPLEHSTPWNVFCFLLLLSGYYIWDTANSQKARFRMQLRGIYVPRWTFPQLPWGTLKNPQYIKAENGGTLLVDGWYKYGRKLHYTADLMMALSWGLITGFNRFPPYFYVCFFCVVLVHRVQRDMERCAKKYGKDWEKYCQTVPYIFIPFVF